MSEKCKIINERFVQPCKSLDQICEPKNPSGKLKGIFSYTYIDTRNLQPVARFFGVKSGKYIKEGLPFKYCPFCGEQIDAPYNKKSISQKSKEGLVNLIKRF